MNQHSQTMKQDKGYKESYKASLIFMLNGDFLKFKKNEALEIFKNILKDQALKYSNKNFLEHLRQTCVFIYNVAPCST